MLVNDFTCVSSQVPFTEVLDLVRGRKVFLSRGFAYVPKDDMISILITHYRAHLSQQLAVGYVYLFVMFLFLLILSNVLFIDLRVIKKHVLRNVFVKFMDKGNWFLSGLKLTVLKLI